MKVRYTDQLKNMIGLHLAYSLAKTNIKILPETEIHCFRSVYIFIPRSVNIHIKAYVWGERVILQTKKKKKKNRTNNSFISILYQDSRTSRLGVFFLFFIFFCHFDYETYGEMIQNRAIRI